MAAAEAGTGFEFAFEGCGERYDDQVGRSVKRDGNNAERRELDEDVVAFRCDKLRNEGEEEESGFGIEGFGQDSLAKGTTARGDCAGGEFGVAGADHFDAEEDEISGTSILNGVEGHSGCGENCGYPERGGEDVEESSEESAEGGLETFAATTGEGAGQDVEDARAGSDGEKHGGGEEQHEAMRIEHGKKSINVEKAKKYSAAGESG